MSLKSFKKKGHAAWKDETRWMKKRLDRGGGSMNEKRELRREIKERKKLANKFERVQGKKASRNLTLE